MVAHTGETYDDLILVGGFSKAYSSLLAFLALPTWLKEHLKVAAPTYPELATARTDFDTTGPEYGYTGMVMLTATR